MCELFSFSLNFNQVIVEKVNDTINESKEVHLSLEIDGENLVKHRHESFILLDGCYQIKSDFILQSVDLITNEDLIFNVLGSLIKVKLLEIDLKIENEKILCEGYINLLKILQKSLKSKKESTLVMKIQNSNIILTYDIKFENAPEIESTFAIEIPFIHNFALGENEDIEACIRFPFNQNYRAVVLQKSVIDISCDDSEPYLIDETLKVNRIFFQNNSFYIGLAYENFQHLSGMKLFNDLIINNQKFIIELKMQDKMFMTFIDLDIFNYPGVNDITFKVPLYEWNSKIILQQFQQEASLRLSQLSNTKVEESKKLSENSLSTIADEIVLKEIINDDMHVAITVRIKISKPLHSKESTDELLNKLNKIFPFIKEKKPEDVFINACKKDLECVIRRIAGKMDTFIKQNSHLSDKEMINELKSLILNQNVCLKNELKETIETIIGNTFNVEHKTETNHEFKLLMIDVFKSLSREIERILNRRNQIKQTSYMKEDVRKWQIEEYIERKNFEKAKEIINQELNDNLDEMKLKDRAIYFIKSKDYTNAEEAVLNLLKIDRCCSFAFYLLSYIFIEREEICSAILTLQILTELKTANIEFWILLSTLYEKTLYTCGVKFCELKIQKSEFLPNYSSNIPIKYPEFKSTDTFSAIIYYQLSLSLPKFIQMTKQYMKKNELIFQNLNDQKYLEIIEFLEQEKFKDGFSLIKTLTITDDNEINVRILKGNLLYTTNTWQSICEYEIAYNLCSIGDEKFPYLPAIRCALWYLNNHRNVTKARKYFHFCCKNFGTFESWMGFGNVALISADYKSAEKYFVQANQIDRTSWDNWISLALVNSKLKRNDITLKCYLMAKNFKIPNENEKLNEVEAFLNI